MPHTPRAPHSNARLDVSLAGAQAAIAAAMEVADELDLSVCIAVCDAGGNPVATVRMDGAPMLSLEIATNKAWTVANFNGMPTSQWWPLIEGEPSLVHGITHTPRLVVFGGGEPIRIGDAVAGAVGVSGGSAEQDGVIAAAAAAAVLVD